MRAHAVPPSQFTQIGSPKQNVVDASVRELHCMYLDNCFLDAVHEPDISLDHCSILDHMGIGKDGVIIIHVGVRIPLALRRNSTELT